MDDTKLTHIGGFTKLTYIVWFYAKLTYIDGWILGYTITILHPGSPLIQYSDPNHGNIFPEFPWSIRGKNGYKRRVLLCRTPGEQEKRGKWYTPTSFFREWSATSDRGTRSWRVWGLEFFYFNTINVIDQSPKTIIVVFARFCYGFLHTYYIF